MNAEQKQRAKDVLTNWIADEMAALLQELIDAPEPVVDDWVTAHIDGKTYHNRSPIPPSAKWRLGDLVQKVRGSKWRGKVVGFYSTEATPIGYSVESAFEPGSVQVWPEAALIEWYGEK
jgi:hypothetical protein